MSIYLRAACVSAGFRGKPEVAAAIEFLSLFQMLQASVDDFLDAMKFCAPKVAHVVEPPVDCIEAAIHCVESLFDRFETGADISQQQPDKRRVHHDGEPDYKIQLFVRHYHLVPASDLYSLTN